MNKEYLEILEKIENTGYNAYIIGGFVRDNILKRKTTDIDIITNAPIETLKNIFKTNIKIYPQYGAIKLKTKNYNIDITRMRRELSYKNGKPEKIIFTNKLEQDLKRRDFTINTICMDKNEKIIDLLNSIKDIKNKLIRTVREVKIELKEDPSRIIRALRFMSELDFKLDNELEKYIIKNKNEILKINKNKIKEELDKLFETNNVNKFLHFIKSNKIESTLGIYTNNFIETSNIIGAWAQIELKKEYPFTKKEKNSIKALKTIIQKKELTKYDIYINGLEISLLAAKLLNLDERKINLIYTNLPIKSIIDIDIKSDEIIEYLKISENKYLGQIFKLLEKEIIEGKIQNKKENIIIRLNELR